MQLHPITLGVTPATWAAWLRPASPPQGAPNTEPCRHCGDPAPVGATVAAGEATCVLCAAPQNLGRDTIAQEATLIWAPQIAWADLNRIVVSIHRVYQAHGEPPCLDQRPSADTPRLRGAYRAYAALAALGTAAQARVGTTSPRDLGAALFGLRQRPAVLAGLRLLHRGRHFVAGRDAYPDLLAATRPE